MICQLWVAKTLIRYYSSQSKTVETTLVYHILFVRLVSSGNCWPDSSHDRSCAHCSYYFQKMCNYFRSLFSIVGSILLYIRTLFFSVLVLHIYAFNHCVWHTNLQFLLMYNFVHKLTNLSYQLIFGSVPISKIVILYQKRIQLRHGLMTSFFSPFAKDAFVV